MTSRAQDSTHAITQEDAVGTHRVELPGGNGDLVIITHSDDPKHGRELTLPRRKDDAPPVDTLSAAWNRKEGRNG